MNTIEKLQAIEAKKTIYNICYRNAGVGIMFFYPDRVPTRDLPSDARDPKDWEAGLSIDKYYPTFEDAVDAEYKKL